MFVVLLRSEGLLWHYSGVTYATWQKARKFARHITDIAPDAITQITPQSLLGSFPLAPPG